MPNYGGSQLFYLGSGVNTSYFQGLIIEYLDLRKVCMAVFPAFKKVTMKMHNLEHYCFQLLDCGPFTCVWTARSESRHRDFVNYAESAKNFINLLKTLCEKNQKKFSLFRIHYISEQSTHSFFIDYAQRRNSLLRNIQSLADFKTSNSSKNIPVQKILYILYIAWK